MSTHRLVRCPRCHGRYNAASPREFCPLCGARIAPSAELPEAVADAPHREIAPEAEGPPSAAEPTASPGAAAAQEGASAASHLQEILRDTLGVEEGVEADRPPAGVAGGPARAGRPPSGSGPGDGRPARALRIGVPAALAVAALGCLAVGVVLLRKHGVGAVGPLECPGQVVEHGGPRRLGSSRTPVWVQIEVPRWLEFRGRPHRVEVALASSDPRRAGRFEAVIRGVAPVIDARRDVLVLEAGIRDEDIPDAFRPGAPVRAWIEFMPRATADRSDERGAAGRSFLGSLDRLASRMNEGPALWVSALLIGGLGGLWCFYGYRLFKLVVVLYGAVLGVLAGGAIGAAQGAEGGAIVGGAIGAVVGGLLMLALYFAAIFALGAGVGGLAALGLFLSAEAEPNAAVIGCAAIAGGITALIVQKLVLITLTALCGAAGAVAAVLCLALQTIRAPLRVWSAGRNALLAVALSWILLGVAGILLQYGVTGKRPPRRRRERTTI